MFLRLVSQDTMNSLQTEKGIGLIEVMIALAILLLTALATGSLQTSSLVSAQGSSVHFLIDHLSSDMLETLRSHSVDAEAGLFDFDAAAGSTGVSTPSTAPSPTNTANGLAQAWNDRIAESIPTGQGSISCVAGICEVSISWMEEIDGTNHRQFYITRTPL